VQVGDLVRFKKEHGVRAVGDVDPRKLYPHKFEAGIVIGGAPGWRHAIVMTVMFPSRTDEFLVGLMEVISESR
jgi:hypothetical protein